MGVTLHGIALAVNTKYTLDFAHTWQEQRRVRLLREIGCDRDKVRVECNQFPPNRLRPVGSDR
jgi:hypothetical protein